MGLRNKNCSGYICHVVENNSQELTSSQKEMLEFLKIGYVSMNPNPKNFKILHLLQFNNYTYVEIFYPDAKNFEGHKLLVYKGQVGDKLLATKELDPHFQDGGMGPIARFEPSEEGRVMAIEFAKG